MGFGSRTHADVDEFVATSGGRVCGFLLMIPTTLRARGQLSRVFVARSYRGRGVGSALIDAAIEIARDRGYRELFLESDKAFTNAVQYYERHGWVRLGPPVSSLRSCARSTLNSTPAPAFP